MAETDPVLTEAIRIAHESDSFAALDHLERTGDTATVAGRYSQSVFVLYRDGDVPRMIAFARAGIRFCLHRANAATDPLEGAKLRGLAKTMAYNLGSNCWPGWRDEGITLEATDLANGLDAARLNLRLADELERPADKRAAAHWLLGAQLLAAGDAKAASDAFVAAARLYGEADVPMPNEKAMCLAYAALAEMTVPARRRTATGMFESALKGLRDDGSDDAKFYADQLSTARTVFVEDSP